MRAKSPRVNRFQAFLLVFLVWAAIYLPGLGSTELKGEEGRRILPAMTMLETGNFLVPYVGGKPYLRKPPLISWGIAALFNGTGLRNEWMARLPSVLSVLAAAVVIIALAGREGWLSVEVSVVAALLFLTQLATIEKGRLAEIEAMYFSLSGIAIFCWLAWWAQGRSPWLTWVAPLAILGVSALAKYQVNLLFFYPIVIAVLWQAREMRLLLHAAHFVGLAVMLGIFAAWMYPYSQQEVAKHAAGVAMAQSFGRLAGEFNFGGWLLNIPRALSNHLPWILFAPLLWKRDLAPLGATEIALFRGTRLAVVAMFFGVLLLPGMLPRYTLPLLIPFSLLLAYALADERLLPVARALRIWWRTNTALAVVVIVAAFAAPAAGAWLRREFLAEPKRFPAGLAIHFEFVLLAVAGALFLGIFVVLGRHKLARPALLASGSAAVISAAVLLFATIGIPLMNSRDRLRPAARQIDSALPVGSSLVAFDPDYQPLLFYVQTPFRYAVALEDIPPAETASEPPVAEAVSTAAAQLDLANLEERIKAAQVVPKKAPPGPPWVLTRQEIRKRVTDEFPKYEVALELPKPLKLVLLRPGPPPVVPAPPAPVPLEDLPQSAPGSR